MPGSRTTLASSLLSLSLLCAAAHAQDATAPDPNPLAFKGTDWTATFYGVADIGYVDRWGSSPGDGPTRARGYQTAAGSDGSRLGFKFAINIFATTRLIGNVEYGINPPGHEDAGSEDRLAFTRTAYLGLAGNWGTFLGGKVDGARATVLKAYDVFQGRSVASAGSLQQVVSRASDAVAYVTPEWQGLTVTMAYTWNLTGLNHHDEASPLYAVKLDYKHGPLQLSYDHEEEWWNSVPGLSRLKVNTAGGSYAFPWFTLMGFVDHTSINRPFDPAALGYFQAHWGYSLGASVPVGADDIAKVSWNRRDSKYTNNECDKWGVGYQHNLTKHAYVYTDFATINNRNGGTCTIAYTNEQTSVELGTGDAGGHGDRGVDVGFVYSF
jgi:predicted porin